MRTHKIPAWEVIENGLSKILYQQTLVIDALGRGATRVVYTPQERICCFDRTEDNDNCYMCNSGIPFVRNNND